MPKTPLRSDGITTCQRCVRGFIPASFGARQRAGSRRGASVMPPRARRLRCLPAVTRRSRSPLLPALQF